MDDSNRPGLVLAAAALVLTAATGAAARGPDWWGLGAVAVSPDGKTVITGGQNCTLYVLEAASLKVTRRHWLWTRIGALAFNRDGSVIVIEDDKNTVHFLRADTLKAVAMVKDTSYVSVCRSADLVAGARGGGWRGAQAVCILSLNDGSEKAKMDLPDGTQVNRVALSPDGHRLAVLTREFKNDETVVKRDQQPKDLKGTAASEYRMKHDGKGSKLLIYEAPSGKLLQTHDLWYTSSHRNTTLLFDGQTAVVFNYNSVNAKIETDGSIELFGAGGLAYGRGVSPDAKAFLKGGMGPLGGVHVTVKDLKTKRFRIKAIKGWPEYFAGFAFHTDGSAYGVTSCFRIVKLSKEAKVERVVPVY